MSSGQGDARSPAGKVHECSGDTGVFIVTGKEALEREPGRSYGLGPLPPTIEPPKTLAENLKTARDVVAIEGRMAPPSRRP